MSPSSRCWVEGTTQTQSQNNQQRFSRSCLLIKLRYLTHSKLLILILSREDKTQFKKCLEPSWDMTNTQKHWFHRNTRRTTWNRFYWDQLPERLRATFAICFGSTGIGRVNLERHSLTSLYRLNGIIKGRRLRLWNWWASGSQFKLRTCYSCCLRILARTILRRLKDRSIAWLKLGSMQWKPWKSFPTRNWRMCYCNWCRLWSTSPYSSLL